MRQLKENKPNKGFKKAFRAGIILVLLLSLVISWISVTVINSVNRKIDRKDKTEEEGSSPEWTDKQDTFFVEKIKEVKVRDTIYKYVQPPTQVKPKTDDLVAPKRDTLSK